MGSPMNVIFMPISRVPFAVNRIEGSREAQYNWYSCRRVMWTYLVLFRPLAGFDSLSESMLTCNVFHIVIKSFLPCAENTPPAVVVPPHVGPPARPARVVVASAAVEREIIPFASFAAAKRGWLMRSTM